MVKVSLKVEGGQIAWQVKLKKKSPLQERHLFYERQVKHGSWQLRHLAFDPKLPSGHCFKQESLN